MTCHRILSALMFVFALTIAAAAQEWRGVGRVGGRVVDENGQPIAGVTVKAMLPRSGNRGPETKSNARGEWAVGGIAGGEWALDFIKDGYETKNISVSVAESSRLPPMKIELRKAARTTEPTEEIRLKLTEAAGLMNNKQFAQARAIYEELAAKYPDVKQFRPLIARSYYGEGDKRAAIEHLRQALTQDPENIEVMLLLASTLMEDKQADEARQVLASIDESKITDPVVLVNAGIALLNDQKTEEALPWFDKAVTRFPAHPDGYYYRGISQLSLGKTAEAKADLEKYVSIAPADAPEVATAKKILETMK
ncbi:MAG TPA: tetratricopeptide repeat protein [Vicinamibacterales bacterium]|nr:tetratricopeptide repeat protein [Vicinamibacterales bacterium]